MKHLKKLTILHSNDMQGGFLAEKIDEKLVGGVSLLSGYVNRVRREEPNVLYAIAGDMFRGSVIDSEYRGTSTIGIITEDVLAQTKNDEIISSFVDIGEVAREVIPPSGQSEKHPEGCFSYLFRR